MEGGRALAQLPREGVGVSPSGAIPIPPGCVPLSPAPGAPALAWVISRAPFQAQTFRDSVWHAPVTPWLWRWWVIGLGVPTGPAWRCQGEIEAEFAPWGFDNHHQTTPAAPLWLPGCWWSALVRCRTGPNPASARESDASCEDGIPAAPKSMVLPSQQHLGDARDDNHHSHHLRAPLQQGLWGLQPAQCSSYWGLQEEMNAGGLLQHIQSGHWHGEG